MKFALLSTLFAGAAAFTAPVARPTASKLYSEASVTDETAPAEPAFPTINGETYVQILNGTGTNVEIVAISVPLNP